MTTRDQRQVLKCRRPALCGSLNIVTDGTCTEDKYRAYFTFLWNFICTQGATVPFTAVQGVRRHVGGTATPLTRDTRIRTRHIDQIRPSNDLYAISALCFKTHRISPKSLSLVYSILVNISNFSAQSFSSRRLITSNYHLKHLTIAQNNLTPSSHL